jgi:predicted alpha/beta superfamily hydrolase
VLNRRLPPTGGEVADTVPKWKDDGPYYPPTLLPKVETLSEQFEMPQLIRTRRISALLPHDYHDSDRRYPVLYLQDGQNLFDDFAPFGNWAVDKRMAMLSEREMGGLIIIAIDHAEEQRIAEFTPSVRTRLGFGDGKRYVRFLADTLKPYVDQNFRTLPGRSHTGIGGSSMGGLISIYAALMYPEVYGKLMVFSPSLWVAPNLGQWKSALSEPFQGKIYLYGGGRESPNLLSQIQRLEKNLKTNNLTARTRFKFSVDPEGQHNEARWGKEFPKAVAWLFFDEEEDKVVSSGPSQKTPTYIP